MYKWEVIGLLVDEGRRKKVVIKANNKEEAIKKGLKKIGTKNLVNCSLAR